jgi:hypothetical protein
LQVVDFISSILEIGFGICEVITKTLRIVILPGNWVSAVDVVWVN